MKTYEIVIEGSHAEESRVRFDKLVEEFARALQVAGYPSTVHATWEVHRIPTQEAPAEPEQAAVLTVAFASATAARLADEANLVDTDFGDYEPSGESGYTAQDVRDIRKERGL